MPAAEGVFAFHRHCPEKSRLRSSPGTSCFSVSGRMYSAGILKDILTAQKAEVIQVVLETFDQEKYEKAMKQEGYEDGYNDGRTDGYSAGREDGLRQLISALMAIRKKYGMSEREIIAEISQKYNLTEDEAVQKINQFLAG